MPASWNQLGLLIFLLLLSCRHIKTTDQVPATPAPITALPTTLRSVVLKADSHREKVEVWDPVKLELQCRWSGHENKLQNISGRWSKDGKDIEESHQIIQLENEQFILTRVFSILSEENLGNYSCLFGDEAKMDFILTAPHTGTMRDKPIIGYVGDYVVIECHIDEAKPMPKTWTWYRENGTEKIQISTNSQRHKIEINDFKTKLVVGNLTEADAGVYYCGAVYSISTTMNPVELKVITFWEPLKPFIAILVEVFILVAAIALYERSQSKRNHEEENRTSADQTNSPTQEENSEQEGNSAVRQRRV